MQRFPTAKMRSLIIKMQSRYDRALNTEWLPTDKPLRQLIHDRQITKAQIAFLLNR